MLVNPIDLSAADLSDAVHERHLSCREVMAAYLDRIDERNPRHNAIVSLRGRDELLAEAAVCDDELAAGAVRRLRRHEERDDLRDLWPSDDEIGTAVAAAADASLYRSSYANLFAGDARWRALSVPTGRTYAWDPASTYIARPAFTEGISLAATPTADILGARALLLLGDSVTTDHISPAGSIRADSPAGRWLIERGVAPGDFNSYGARRGHDEVMMRGTFANIRLRNALAGDREGPITTHLPSGDILPVADAAARYAESATPLVIIAGKEYGSGSSRDWAAKGTQMLGVRAVIAESYERIHRSNLIGMGILPLQFLPGEGAARHGLTGRERFTLQGLAAIGPRERITMLVDSVGDDGAPTGDRRSIDVIVRLDGPIECDTYRQGGIMPAVLRRMAKQ